MNGGLPGNLPDTEIKSCCARLYETDMVRLLLGDSYHPGGLALTRQLGTLAGLDAGTRVLDVASGTGTSALHLAETFGCTVVGIDYGEGNVQRANDAAREAGLTERVCFRTGDSERLPVDDASFDAVLCECAFCTFPNKSAAAREFARVLVPGRRVAISDITRSAELPPELKSLMAWVACIADAQPLETYAEILTEAGLNVGHTSSLDHVLEEMVRQIRLRLLGLEVAVGLGKLDIGDLDFDSAKALAGAAEAAIRTQQLGYGLIIATR